LGRRGTRSRCRKTCALGRCSLPLGPILPVLKSSADRRSVAPSSFVSDLQGGIFARGTYGPNAQPTEPSGLKLHHLPTSSAPASESTLPDLEIDGDGTFMDLAIDPGQDLVVVVRKSPTRPVSLREVLEPKGSRSSYQLLLFDLAGRPKRGVDRLEMDVRTLYPPITASAFPVKDARPLLHILGDTLAVMVCPPCPPPSPLSRHVLMSLRYTDRRDRHDGERLHLRMELADGREALRWSFL